MGNPDGSDDEDRMIPTLVPGAQKWAAVSAGHRHTCAREEDGSLWCFGTAAEGELGVRAVAGRPSAGPSQLKDQPWVGFDLGNSYSCGVREGGALYCWGRNDVGQLGIGGGPGVGQPARVCLP